jgi:prefoldin subunit 5
MSTSAAPSTGVTTTEIAAAAGVSIDAVGQWARRYVDDFIVVPGKGRSVHYDRDKVIAFFERRVEHYDQRARDAISAAIYAEQRQATARNILDAIRRD